ncbi:TIGR03086 family metal-binding protein [Geodermatophilus sp. SYSU D00815]
MESIAERYRRRAAAFERTVASVRPGRWAQPSPCAAWSARDVVDHVVGMHAEVLEPVGRAPVPAGEEPLAAFRAARAAVEAVLDDRALATTADDTPAGRLTVEEHVDRVLSDDLVVHRWDLARATGQDGLMDPGDVAQLWAAATAVPAELMRKFRTPGAFGPGIEVYGAEVPVAATAPLQDRLLGFLGRDPKWRP